MNEILLNYLDVLKKKISQCDRKGRVVYTACLGSYDLLKDPLFIDRETRYVCFTDSQDLRSDIWECIVLDLMPCDPRIIARALKLLPHRLFKSHEMSIWIDAKCLILHSLECLVAVLEMQETDFACFPHTQRSSVRAEAWACLRIGHDTVRKIVLQWLKYRRQGFPDTSQLVETTVLVRRHLNSAVVNFQETWFREVMQESIRDQLSFNYVAWRNKLSYTVYDDFKMSEVIKVIPHLRHGIYDNKTNFSVPIQRRVRDFLIGFIK